MSFVTVTVFSINQQSRRYSEIFLTQCLSGSGQNFILRRPGASAEEAKGAQAPARRLRPPKKHPTLQRPRVTTRRHRHGDDALAR